LYCKLSAQYDFEGVIPLPPNRFRTGYVATAEDGAVLSFAVSRAKVWKISYAPAPDAIRIASQIASQNHDDFVARNKPIPLVEGNSKTDVVKIYPLNTTATSRAFLRPKYETLLTITLEGFEFGDPTDLEEAKDALSNLPAGFVRDPFFGLGLNWDLRYLPNTIADIGSVTDLRIKRGRSGALPQLAGESYILSAKMFDDTRKAINRAHEKALTIASEEKRVFVHNALLTAIDPSRFPREFRSYHKDAVIDAIGNSLARSVALSAKDREAVVSATKSAARSISRSEPEALLELNREIELVTLEGLVVRLKTMLTKKLREGDWQAFFVDNPFVLRLAFGLPIMMLGDQFSVGGRKFSGSGDKISDFAVKAAASGNLSLIEIKTPETRLLEANAYRGDLYAPGRELAGAVNQVLDQRYQLQKSITNLKDASNAWDVESYAIQGMVVAGRMPTGRPQLKSFELFRNGLKSVVVVTFDELLQKLEHLIEVLSAPPSAKISTPNTDDKVLPANPSSD
jgi:hypothetical protein